MCIRDRKNTVRYEDNNWRYWKESKESAVDVSLGSVDKTIRIFTDKYNGYSGRHNFLLNMGYKNYSAGTMTLTFSMPGEYTFDDLYVVCQPMASVEELSLIHILLSGKPAVHCR